MCVHGFPLVMTPGRTQGPRTESTYLQEVLDGMKRDEEDKEQERVQNHAQDQEWPCGNEREREVKPQKSFELITLGDGIHPFATSLNGEYQNLFNFCRQETHCRPLLENNLKRGKRRGCFLCNKQQDQCVEWRSQVKLVPEF